MRHTPHTPPNYTHRRVQHVCTQAAGCCEDHGRNELRPQPPQPPCSVRRTVEQRRARAQHAHTATKQHKFCQTAERRRTTDASVTHPAASMNRLTLTLVAPVVPQVYRTRTVSPIVRPPITSNLPPVPGRQPCTGGLVPVAHPVPVGRGHSVNTSLEKLECRAGLSEHQCASEASKCQPRVSAESGLSVTGTRCAQRASGEYCSAKSRAVRERVTDEDRRR
jgi:hypothetical protein